MYEAAPMLIWFFGSIIIIYMSVLAKLLNDIKKELKNGRDSH